MGFRSHCLTGRRAGRPGADPFPSRRASERREPRGAGPRVSGWVSQPLRGQRAGAAWTPSPVKTNPFLSSSSRAAPGTSAARAGGRLCLCRGGAQGLTDGASARPAAAAAASRACALAHRDPALARPALPRAPARRLRGTRRLRLGRRADARVPAGRRRAARAGGKSPAATAPAPSYSPPSGSRSPLLPTPPPAAARAHALPEREGRLRVCGGGRAELRARRVRTWGRGMVSARGGAGGAAAAADATAAAAAAAASAPASRR